VSFPIPFPLLFLLIRASAFSPIHRDLK
jgi:hypothetical protein